MTSACDALPHGQQAVETPPSNDMGAQNIAATHPVSWGIHNFSGTIRGRSLKAVLGLLNWVLGNFKAEPMSAWEHMPNGGRGYRHILRGPFGTKVYYSDLREDIHFEIPGEACEAAGTKALVRLFRHDTIRGTRVDSAWDVPFERCPSIEELRQMALETFGRLGLGVAPTTRHMRTKASTWEFYESSDGSTLYIGSRQSDVYLRIYNRRGVMRFELQARGDVAAMLTGWHRPAYSWVRLRDDFTVSSLEQWCTSALRNYVDFVVPGCRNHSLAPLSPWWFALFGGVGKSRVARTRAVPDLVARSKDWIVRQVAPTLALLHQMSVVRSDGSFWEFLHMSIQDGLTRLRPHQSVLISPTPAHVLANA